MSHRRLLFASIFFKGFILKIILCSSTLCGESLYNNWTVTGIFKNSKSDNTNWRSFKYEEKFGVEFSNLGFNGYFKFELEKKGFALNVQKNLNNQNNKSFIGLHYPDSFLKIKKNNISSLRYMNSWVLLQFGHGNEDWGVGDGISLALSEYSEPYDYFLLASNYGRIRVRYIHGFLEQTVENYNRFITGRGVEFHKKNTLIGLSEIVIYSGINRSFDLGYANPISTHLEIEINDRMNFPTYVNASNAVWQIHFQQIFNNKIKISFNYLVDEFVLDPKLEQNKDNGDALSFQISSPMPKFSNIFISSSIIYVGTKTFRHGLGTNNFVNQGKPLGWQSGSDGYDFNFGFFFSSKTIKSKLTFGIFESGDESIVSRIFDQYQDYFKTPFPSGNALKSNYIDFYLIFKLNKNVHFTTGGSYSNLENKRKAIFNSIFEMSFLI